MRVFALSALSVLVCGAPAVGSGVPLRHVEYAVRTTVAGQSAASRLLLDLIATTPGGGLTLDLTAPDRGETVRVDVAGDGAATVRSGGELGRAGAALLYFFALGSQNLTGMGPGDAWSVDGSAGDGAQQVTHFRVVARPVDGWLDVAVVRAVSAADTRVEYRGRLLYDAFKVVPISFDLSGNVHENEGGLDRTYPIRVAATLVSDSQR